MVEKTIKVDFSAVENIKFECIKDCGRCCYGQAPLVTTSEINRIRTHLKKKSQEEYNRFIFDWLSYQNMLHLMSDDLYQDCKKGIEWFWAPFQLEEMKEVVLVRNYTVYAMPSSGRCKLLNPIDFTCFVYAARPVTCQLYPFTQDIDETGTFRVKIGMQNCPGYGSGSHIDKNAIQEITQKNWIELNKDVELYKNFVQRKGYTRPKRKKLKKKPKKEDIEKMIRDFENSWRDMYFFGKKGKFEDVLAKKKKIIEPLAELGIIPPHFLLVLYNERLEK